MWQTHIFRRDATLATLLMAILMSLAFGGIYWIGLWKHELAICMILGWSFARIRSGAEIDSGNLYSTFLVLLALLLVTVNLVGPVSLSREVIALLSPEDFRRGGRCLKSDLCADERAFVTVEPSDGERQEVSEEDRRLIDLALKEKIPQVKKCYVEGLAHDPNLGGKVIISFRIDGSGGVRDLAIQTSDLDRLDVEMCILDALQTTRFPPIAHGGEVVVRYPFLLSQ